MSGMIKVLSVLPSTLPVCGPQGEMQPGMGKGHSACMPPTACGSRGGWHQGGSLWLHSAWRNKLCGPYLMSV